MSSIPGFFLKKYMQSPRKEWMRFDSIFMVAGIIISVAVLTVALSLFEGYENVLKKTILGVNSHIYVFRPGEENLTTANLEELDVFLDDQEEVDSWSAVIMSQAMLVQDSRIKGCLIRGIDWAKETLPTQYKKFVFDGSYKLETSKDIVIGYRLAETFQIGVGDTIKIVNSLNSELTPLGLRTSGDEFIVTGLYKSGMYEYDTKFVFMNLFAAEKFSGLKEERSMLEIKVQSEKIESADYLAYKWEKSLNEFDYRYQISSWIDFNGNLFSLLKLQKWVIFFILIFLVVVASFNVISSVSTSIIEKKRELGILRAYGASNRLLGKIFIGKSLILGAIAVILGLLLGIGISTFLASQSILLLKADVYFLDKIQVEFRLFSILLIAAAALLIITVASYIPLKKIRNMQITDVLRNE